jgi:hypothetical protein
MQRSPKFRGILPIAREGGDIFQMNDMEFGILLNFIFWIVALPAFVIFVVWVCVVFFDAMDNAHPRREGPGCISASLQTSEEANERYRKTA